MCGNTILEKWENLGFLSEIESDKKEQLALHYEEAYVYLINNRHDDSIETFIFPIIFRLTKQTDLELKPIELIDKFRDFINRSDIREITTEIYGSNIDMEAEIVNLFINEIKN